MGSPQRLTPERTKIEVLTGNRCSFEFCDFEVLAGDLGKVLKGVLIGVLVGVLEGVLEGVLVSKEHRC